MITNTTELMEFKKFIMDMDLIDIPVLGKKFTWFQYDGRAASRLDGFLLSEELISKCNVNAQWVGERDISYHCPVW
jgi:exonuclease III